MSKYPRTIFWNNHVYIKNRVLACHKHVLIENFWFSKVLVLRVLVKIANFGGTCFRRRTKLNLMLKFLNNRFSSTTINLQPTGYIFEVILVDRLVNWVLNSQSNPTSNHSFKTWWIFKINHSVNDIFNKQKFVVYNDYN